MLFVTAKMDDLDSPTHSGWVAQRRKAGETGSEVEEANGNYGEDL